jgi:hypothetical protein
MEDRFRRNFVKQIDNLLRTLQEENDDPPGREELVLLLGFADPGCFTLSDCSNTVKREKMLKKLKLLVHPDKHPTTEKVAATQRFQNVQTLYDKCVQNLARPWKKSKSSSSSSFNRKKRSSTSSTTSITTFPDTYHIIVTWSFLDRVTLEPMWPIGCHSFVYLSRTLAYRCLNIRGAIAHGRCPTELVFTFPTHVVGTSTNNTNTVSQVFDTCGGTKTLHSIDEIKTELVRTLLYTNLSGMIATKCIIYLCTNTQPVFTFFLFYVVCVCIYIYMLTNTQYYFYYGLYITLDDPWSSGFGILCLDTGIRQGCYK